MAAASSSQDSGENTEESHQLQRAHSKLTKRRPRPAKTWVHRTRKYVKFLVVGDSGLGKTTLIRALFSVPGQELQLHDGTETSPEQFRRDPDSLCSTISWEDEEDTTTWVYQVQDTPGYGDDLNLYNSFRSMMHYIEAQNRRYLAIELDKQREVDMAEIPDPRVDCCIFCLPPHRLRPVDLRYMLELGRYCPIIPVVTKSDTMTIAEAARYRREVREKLQNPFVPDARALQHARGEPVNVLHFEDDTLARAGLQHKDKHTVPFLVVASNEVSHSMRDRDPPVHWPVRDYRWGTSEAFNPEHSDLLYLRQLLLEEACEEIAAAKRHRYQLWRKRQLNQRKAVHKLFRTLLWIAVPVGLGTLAVRTQPQLQDQLQGLQQRVKRTSKEVQQELAVATGRKESKAEDKPKKKFGSLF